ncbi:hypothetical protein [Trinickia dinghuensis]|uniref:Uncharacterized protein n=1 Tax=Trinickia dinghuensis TaxID=2291023 RepID=A0A3D8K167_9BURK|nr:hypothetical protein [Trinickia dinghuensis]RDU99197.1 hypothetical protein DWV00_08715 [Trinickia dinghuensis]
MVMLGVTSVREGDLVRRRRRWRDAPGRRAETTIVSTAFLNSIQGELSAALIPQPDPDWISIEEQHRRDARAYGISDDWDALLEQRHREFKLYPWAFNEPDAYPDSKADRSEPRTGVRVLQMYPGELAREVLVDPCDWEALLKRRTLEQRIFREWQQYFLPPEDATSGSLASASSATRFEKSRRPRLLRRLMRGFRVLLKPRLLKTSETLRSEAADLDASR